MLKRTSFKKLSFEEAILKLKSKSRPPLKRLKIALKTKKPKKTKKISVSKLHKLVWAECRRVQLERLPHDCYTCPAKNLTGANLQLGHGQSKGSLPLEFKYDLRNLKWQCFFCNIHGQGCQELFLARLENEVAGREFLMESSFKNEHGGWKIQKREPINARDFLTETLARLKLL